MGTKWLSLFLWLLPLSPLLGAAVFVPSSYDGTVSAVDAATYVLLQTITVGGTPQAIVSSADGTKVYVTNTTLNAVSVIDSENFSLLATINVGTNPLNIAVSPLGSSVYVSNFNDDSVSVINTLTNTVVATIFVGNQPGPLTTSLDGSRLFVVNTADGTVSVIDTLRNALLQTVVIGTSMSGSSDLTATLSKIYVCNSSDNTVAVIDTLNNSVVNYFNVGMEPKGIAADFFGAFVYTINSSGESLSQINPLTNQVRTVDLGAQPSDIALSLGGIKIFITCDDGTVKVLDQNLNLISSIPLSGTPLGISLSPDSERGYIANSGSNQLDVINAIQNTEITSVDVGDSPSFAIVAAPYPPPPPSSFCGQVITNYLLALTQRVNSLFWTPTEDVRVVGYFLYKNGNLIGSFSKEGPFTYLDYNTVVNQVDVYTIYSYKLNGTLSLPKSITLK